MFLPFAVIALPIKTPLWWLGKKKAREMRGPKEAFEECIGMPESIGLRRVMSGPNPQ